MTTYTSKVAVIGLGNIGKVVTENLVSGGREIIVASRSLSNAQTFARTFDGKVKAAEIADAIRQADIVVLSVWFSTIGELLGKYRSELKGKIVIDPSNPIAPDGNGGFKKIIGAEQSAGLINAKLLPEGAKLAKALGTLGAASLKNTAFGKPERTVLFYATDDLSINSKVESLITDLGFDPIRIGGIDQSIRIEVFGELHEYGALGKTVTRSELKQPA